MVALAALQQWHMSSVDVKTAFLYGELDEELFMEQPEGFKKKAKSTRCPVLKRHSVDLNKQLCNGGEHLMSLWKPWALNV